MLREDNFDLKLEQAKRFIEALKYLSEEEVRIFTEAAVGAATMNQMREKYFKLTANQSA